MSKEEKRIAEIYLLVGVALGLAFGLLLASSSYSA